MRLAIDFGTSRTRAAVKVAANVAPVPVTLGESADVPNAVYVEPDGRILTGESAWNKRRSADPIRFFSGKQFKLALGGPPREIDGKTYEWADLVEAVLRDALTKAEKEFDAAGKFETLVLTVPAMYEEGAQAWRVMEEAGSRLGLELAPLVREPHAAASWYAKLLRDGGKDIKAGEVVLVYDLGGGTFDAALMRAAAGGFESLQAGGLECGGTLFDELLLQDFAGRFPVAYDATQPAPEESLVQRRARIQRRSVLEDFLQRSVKHQLAEADAVEDDEPVLLEDRYSLTRPEFHRMIGPLLGSTIRCCEELVEREGIAWSELKRIVMVGASCRLPVVREKLAEMIARNGAGEVELLWRRVGDADVRPEVAVVLGAAYSGVNDAIRTQGRLDRSCQVIPQIVGPGVFVAFSPEGRTLLTMHEGVFTAWCMESRRIRRERFLDGVSGTPCFSLDGTRVRFNLHNGSMVWDLASGLLESSTADEKEWASDIDPAWEDKFKNSRAAKTLPTGEATDLWCRFGAEGNALVLNRQSTRWALWDTTNQRFVDSGQLSGAKLAWIEWMVAIPGSKSKVVVQTGYNPDFELSALHIVDIRSGEIESVHAVPAEWSKPALHRGESGLLFQSCTFGSGYYAKMVAEPAAAPLAAARAPKGLGSFKIFESGRSVIWAKGSTAYIHQRVSSEELETSVELSEYIPTSRFRHLHIPLASRDLVLQAPPFGSSDPWVLWRAYDNASEGFPRELKSPTLTANGDQIAFVSRGEDRMTYIWVFEPFQYHTLRTKFAVGRKRLGNIAWAGGADKILAATDNTQEPQLLGILVGEPTPLWEIALEQHGSDLSTNAIGTRAAVRVGADEVILVDSRSGEILARRGIPGSLTGQLLLCPSGELVATLLTTGAVRLIHMTDGVELTLHLFKHGFIAYDNNGNFDATPNFMPYVSIDVGDRLLSDPEDLKPFHNPDAIQSILSRL